ncbi:S66 family peptidase [Chitinophaga sp. 22536]|uniref:S66 family peptidase n=1 Tax=unclassified Chitinophaga TaxID=2619133 RepID=UPI003F8655CB
MNLIKPSRLAAGDKVATISLSWGGAGELPHRYRKGKEQLQQQFGLEVTETENALKPAQWLYENPQARAEDLMEAFADKSVKAIISNIGGEESARILKYVDINIIRNNPKIFLGFSDTTTTHLLCLKAGLTSFYGTSLLTGFAENGGMHRYQIEDINNTFFTAPPVRRIMPNTEGWTSERLEWFDPSLQDIKRKLEPNTGWKFLQGSGTVQGRLIGGCIDVLEFLKGTPYWPEDSYWQDSILFFETSEETVRPELIRYWMRNYALLGILRKAKAILWGRPYDNQYAAEYETEILKVLKEEGLTDMVVVTQMDFGHTCPTFTLPYGVLAEVNCTEKTFTLLEAGVQ